MFSEHGQYAIERDSTIIIFAAQGAWNLEASRNAITLICNYIDSIGDKEFAIIADTRKVEGITPDSREVWLTAIHDWLQKGHTTLARVDKPDSPHYKVFLSGFDDFAKKHQEFRLVDSLKEGLDWVHKQGFQGFQAGPPKIAFVKD